MGKLIYSMSVSLDGSVNSPQGSIDWVEVDEALHSHFNEVSRSVTTSLYGRRMWEVMSGYWPTGEDDPEATPAMREFARLWKGTQKVVFSKTLDHVDWGARLVRGDPVDEVPRLKAEPGAVLDVGGPTLAGALFRAGLVDEVGLYFQPVVVGGGTRFFPDLESMVSMRLLESKTFPGGIIYARYDVGPPEA